jgi:hypothetical protein
MKFFLIPLCALLVTAASVQAQWVDRTYTLLQGWNGVWLAGDASYTTVEELFSKYPEVLEVWRWNPDPDETAFTTTPSTPSTNSEEWTVWKSDHTEQGLTQMIGNSAYLIRCNSDTTVKINQLAIPPAATWLISGANFLGFPAVSGTPTMSSYFASFPSASTTVLAPGAQIYKYPGGELSNDDPNKNPLLVSAGAERMDPNKAYWFQIPTVGNFTAPVEYELPSTSGLAFGRSLTAITAGVTNRSTSSMTLTVSVELSAVAPANQTFVTGPVPLTRRIFNSSTNSYTETAITAPFTVTVPASGRLNLDFGVSRAGMTDSSPYYASILRIKDAGNLTDVQLPVSAQAATTAGLWYAQVKVTNVQNAQNPSSGSTTSQPFPLVFLMHMDSDNIGRLLSQAFVGKLTADGNPQGIALEESGILGYTQSDVKPQRYVAPQLPLTPRFYQAVSGTFATDSTAQWSIPVYFDDPTNPFVHTYHPDHDNLGTDFKTKLKSGDESYTVNRTCSFTFTSSPPDGSTISGWGTTVLGGTYAETLTGLGGTNPTTTAGSKSLTVSGTFAMRRITEISEISDFKPKP